MRQIIVISATRQPPDANGVEDIWVRVAFWFPVAAGSEVPLPQGVSTVGALAFATQAERDALSAGSVLEIVVTLQLPETSTMAQLKTALINAYNQQQSKISNRLNPGVFAGSSFDGTSWAKA